MKCVIVLIIWLAIGFKGAINVLNSDESKRINFAFIAFFVIFLLFIFPLILLDDRGVVNGEAEWLINIANFIKSL